MERPSFGHLLQGNAPAALAFSLLTLRDCLVGHRFVFRALFGTDHATFSRAPLWAGEICYGIGIGCHRLKLQRPYWKAVRRVQLPGVHTSEI